MRVAVITLLTTSLFSAAAMAAPGVPSSVLNPPAYTPGKASSAESRMPGNTDADNDAKTLRGIESRDQQPAPPATNLEDARIRYMELNKQLGDDVRNHANKEVIDQDRAAIAEAKKQLDSFAPKPLPQPSR